MVKQLISTYENNSMSLSCSGEMIIEDNKVLSVYFKGYPRVSGDGWVRSYRETRKDGYISDTEIESILAYDGMNNVVSYIKDIEVD